MKLCSLIAITVLLSVFVIGLNQNTDSNSEILYAGLPSKPLPEDRDQGNNEGEAADEGYDSMGDETPRDRKQGRQNNENKPNRENNNDKEQSGEFERYEDWYDPDPAYN